MKLFRSFSLQKIFSLLFIFFLFACSRYYIHKYWPTNYSDVRTDYERYARMWSYGFTPYTYHQYEYPPLTIPLLYLPLKYEYLGINYYHNYRFEVMIVDMTFFIFLTASIYQIFKNDTDLKKYLILGYYILLTTLAKDFFYEGLDLIFMAAVFSSILLVYWLDTKKVVNKTIVWFFFWLSTAVKFLTLPLMVPLFFIIYSNWKKDLTAFAVSFILVWGIPIIIFKSTLLVPFMVNGNRPIKNASFPSYIIKLIDYQTHTETKSNKPPDFPYTGPVSSFVTKTTTIVFPLSVLLWMIYSLQLILKKKKYSLKLKISILRKVINKEIFRPHSLSKQNKLVLLLTIYGLYLFTLFFFAKIFSQPFHIWYTALVALFPFVIKKNPLWLWIPALIMLTNDMTRLLYLPTNPNSSLFGYPYFMYGYLIFKFIPMALVYYYFIRSSQKDI